MLCDVRLLICGFFKVKERHLNKIYRYLLDLKRSKRTVRLKGQRVMYVSVFFKTNSQDSVQCKK